MLILLPSCPVASGTELLRMLLACCAFWAFWYFAWACNTGFGLVGAIAHASAELANAPRDACDSNCFVCGPPRCARMWPRLLITRTGGCSAGCLLVLIQCCFCLALVCGSCNCAPSLVLLLQLCPKAADACAVVRRVLELLQKGCLSAWILAARR